MTNIQKNFGPFLRQTRKARGLSQVALGKLINPSVPSMQIHISKWESGTVFPRAESLQKLCKVLDFEIVLFGADGRGSVISAPEHYIDIAGHEILIHKGNV